MPSHKVTKLLAKAGVDIQNDEAGVAEAENFQSHLKKFKITVYNYDSKCKEVWYSDAPENVQYKII